MLEPQRIIQLIAPTFWPDYQTAYKSDKGGVDREPIAKLQIGNRLYLEEVT